MAVTNQNQDFPIKLNQGASTVLFKSIAIAVAQSYVAVNDSQMMTDPTEALIFSHSAMTHRHCGATCAQCCMTEMLIITYRVFIVHLPL